MIKYLNFSVDEVASWLPVQVCLSSYSSPSMEAAGGFRCTVSQYALKGYCQAVSCRFFFDSSEFSGRK